MEDKNIKKIAKFSKDPKIKVITLDVFFDMSNKFKDIKSKYFDDGINPDAGEYYRITSKYLVIVKYGYTITNFGLDLTEKLENIFVAYRDGKTEYELANKELKKLINRKNKDKKNRSLKRDIGDLEFCIDLLNEYNFFQDVETETKEFEEYIVDVGYKTCRNDLKNKYIVFDVETNGIRRTNDDLLSISIYDPTTGKCYNRYLPLELQPVVLTSHINGITEKDIYTAQHIEQKELDNLIEYFDLKNKVLLSYSGGNGTFDSTFIINYCKRHNLTGFEDLTYENIKSIVPDPGFGFEGLLTKDNFCKIFGIEGIEKIHSSLNDCVLEWKLFEKLKNEPLFFIDRYLFKYHDGYIVPVTYLLHHPELAEFAKIDVPHIECKVEVVFDYTVPTNVLKKVKKFGTNITGISLENGIRSALKIKSENNIDFLIKNKKNLEFIGSIESRYEEIPVELNDDGTIRTPLQEKEAEIKEVNDVTRILIDSFKPILQFIEHKIFDSKEVLYQELTISDDGKVLALCDLSNSQNVLELKTFSIFSDMSISKNVATQLYYQSKGRNTFALSIDINTKLNGKGKNVVESVNATIYQISIEATEEKPIKGVYTLFGRELEVFKLLVENPSFSNAQISKITGWSPNSVGKIVKDLKELKYIKKEDETKKFSKWCILRSADDLETKCIFYKGIIIKIFDNDEDELL